MHKVVSKGSSSTTKVLSVVEEPSPQGRGVSKPPTAGVAAGSTAQDAA